MGLCEGLVASRDEAGIMNREKEIFSIAAELETPQERAAYLKGACGDDTALREAVEELLGAHFEVHDFLPTMPGDIAPLTEGEGSVIGRYKLLQKLGEGGFGIVYMAEQREPVKRRVALKVIKLGMDTKHVVGRFEAERQALALMDHPHIAKVLDGGATDQGRPYFVMELVRGIPVTQYSDENQLTTHERLSLFAKICAAVGHAHQKGVIHRDLKPDNVLVSMGDGQDHHPKVIDFGIAKATQQELTDKTLFTRFEEFVGTPVYMSPEQANYSQLDIDTRTDVYSLGVLLYELLSGKPPFNSKDLLSSGVDEIRRRIREEDPPRPSTRLHGLEEATRSRIAERRSVQPDVLRKTLRQEIDWIIMKAMEKDRNRRYATVDALAADIERYLRGEPVEACPPTASYRFQKALRQNKAAVTLIGAVFAALAIGALVSAWQAIRVTKANARSTTLLRNSYEVQASALRKTIEPGRHFKTLETLAAAAKIQPSLSLRNEAIAAMILPDVKLSQPLPRHRTSSTFAVDSVAEHYAAYEEDGTGTLFRVSDHSKVSDLPSMGGKVKRVRFGPFGKSLAVSSDRDGLHVTVFDKLTKGLQIKDASPYAWDFSPNGRQLAVGLSQLHAIALFDLASRKQVAQFPYEPFPGKTGISYVLQYDPSGKRLAVVAGSQNISEQLVIYDLESQQEWMRLTDNPGRLRNVAWHPNGKSLAVSCEDFNIYVWDLESQSQTSVLRGHLSQPSQLSFHPSGRVLCSSAWDTHDSHLGTPQRALSLGVSRSASPICE